MSDTNHPRKGEIAVYNPAFDITPPRLIELIITDIGVFKPNQIGTLTPTSMRQEVKERLGKWGLSLPY